jgi:cytochrome P450
MFAMKDTLATNCAHAAALIAAHPPAQDAARAEVVATDLSDPAAVDRMTYLEGCLREAMRLWPTTPLIVRKARRDADLQGHRVREGAQVVIHNGFNHRNVETVPEPDRFRPERWEPGVWDYRFNPMSNGPQVCAGRELVLFLGKAVLGRLFVAHGWTLTAPSLAADRPVPHAFDHSALRLTPERT